MSDYLHFYTKLHKAEKKTLKWLSTMSDYLHFYRSDCTYEYLEYLGDYPLCRIIFISTLSQWHHLWGMISDYPLCRIIFISTFYLELPDRFYMKSDYPLCRIIFISTVTSENPHKQELKEIIFAYYSQNILTMSCFMPKTVLNLFSAIFVTQILRKHSFTICN